MNQRSNWIRKAQFVVVVLCALAVKLYYSTAGVNQVRWILAPTTVLVELVSGRQFEFESHAGYLSSDRTFLIAASCAGINFLITAFLLLSLRKLWKDRSPNIPWRTIPFAGLFAYVATLVANTVRISIALQLQHMPLEISGLDPNQLHRGEGILIYFGFLLLLFVISEKLDNRDESSTDRIQSLSWQNASELLRQSLFPLLIYYAITLGIPLANIVYHKRTEFGRETDFWEHSLFVLFIPLILTPLLLFLLLAISSFSRNPGAALAAGKLRDESKHS